mmetsp:Transcript_159657/g.512325  ORF Transcript_159657/g.512325 Transcript_159657/m.512325 type:complete len:243 (-) Transcript_159657:660-1388(-)
MCSARVSPWGRRPPILLSRVWRRLRRSRQPRLSQLPLTKSSPMLRQHLQLKRLAALLVLPRRLVSLTRSRCMCWRPWLRPMGATTAPSSLHSEAAPTASWTMWPFAVPRKQVQPQPLLQLLTSGMSRHRGRCAAAAGAWASCAAPRRMLGQVVTRMRRTSLPRTGLRCGSLQQFQQHLRRCQQQCRSPRRCRPLFALTARRSPRVFQPQCEHGGLPRSSFERASRSLYGTNVQRHSHRACIL